MKREGRDCEIRLCMLAYQQYTQAPKTAVQTQIQNIKKITSWACETGNLYATRSVPCTATLAFFLSALFPGSSIRAVRKRHHPIKPKSIKKHQNGIQKASLKSTEKLGSPCAFLCSPSRIICCSTGCLRRAHVRRCLSTADIRQTCIIFRFLHFLSLLLVFIPSLYFALANALIYPVTSHLVPTRSAHH